MKSLSKQKMHIPLGLFLKKHTCVNKNKMLIIWDDNIGDVVVIAGFINYLKKHNYDVWLIVREELRDVGAVLAGAQVIGLNPYLYRNTIRYRLNFLNKIREMGFAVAVSSILHSSVNIDILANCGARVRWAYKRNNSFKEKMRLRAATNIVKSLDYKINELLCRSILDHLAHYLSGIAGKTVTEEEIIPKLDVPAEKYTPLTEIKYLLYLADAGGPLREYPPHLALPVLKNFAAQNNLSLVVTAVRSVEIEEDENIINLTGRTALKEMISIISGAQVVVGNESGLTHLAWIMGKAVIMFYGGGHNGWFRPQCITLSKQMPCFTCDWKCKYDALPAPCIMVNSSEIKAALHMALPEKER
ncbi:ADP-heptose:LPS heptosyltransferase [Elusimicrobium simillimum]|uniref:glycosyltransferase family 9 protein n=1 Tax=Elusimicrobium simillimum TaxID=3143438 RepID=UPI003C704C21